MDEAGDFDVTAAVSISDDPTQAVLEFGLVSFDNATGELTPGVDDIDTAAPLVTVRFRAKTGGTTAVGIQFDHPGATTDSNLVSIVSGSVEDILLAPDGDVVVTIAQGCFDFNETGTVDVGDLMQVAAHWNSQEGDVMYEMAFDLDDDGDIDVADLQIVSVGWNVICGGGQ
jgi:hypothetical protein